MAQSTMPRLLQRLASRRTLSCSAFMVQTFAPAMSGLCTLQVVMVAHGAQLQRPNCPTSDECKHVAHLPREDGDLSLKVHRWFSSAAPIDDVNAVAWDFGPPNSTMFTCSPPLSIANNCFRQPPAPEQLHHSFSASEHLNATHCSIGSHAGV